MLRKKKSPVTRPGIDPQTFRLIAQRLNHYVTHAPETNYHKWAYFKKIIDPHRHVLDIVTPVFFNVFPITKNPSNAHFYVSFKDSFQYKSNERTVSTTLTRNTAVRFLSVGNNVSSLQRAVSSVYHAEIRCAQKAC